MESFLNKNFLNLDKIATEYNQIYEKAEPFPNIVFDNFFSNEILDKVLKNFPKNIQDIGNEYNTKAENLNDPLKFSNDTNNFINYLNSAQFVKFLNKLTGIKETLVTDPYLLGGGLHELRNGGYLNIHADFNQHRSMKLDRRLNMLIYLNKNWSENNGGQLELWDRKMQKCVKNIIPIFNRTLFSTIFLIMVTQ